MADEFKYDPKRARCVSHNDLHRMLSDDGPTKANLLCLVDCLHYGFHQKDTFRPALRVAASGAPASHDSVVSEVINRLGPALGEQINAAVAAGIAAAGLGNGPAPVHAGGNGGGGNGGGNGDDTAVMEAPPVPAGYGHPQIHQPSEVHGDAKDVDPEDFKGALALAEDTTNLKTEPLPVPLTADELAVIRAQIKPQ